MRSLAGSIESGKTPLTHAPKYVGYLYRQTGAFFNKEVELGEWKTKNGNEAYDNARLVIAGAVGVVAGIAGFRWSWKESGRGIFYDASNALMVGGAAACAAWAAHILAPIAAVIWLEDKSAEWKKRRKD